MHKPYLFGQILCPKSGGAGYLQVRLTHKCLWYVSCRSRSKNSHLQGHLCHHVVLCHLVHLSFPCLQLDQVALDLPYHLVHPEMEDQYLKC